MSVHFHPHRHCLSGCLSPRHCLSYLYRRFCLSDLPSRHCLSGCLSPRHCLSYLYRRFCLSYLLSLRHCLSYLLSPRHCLSGCLCGLMFFMTATAGAEENSLTIGAGAAQLAVRDPVGVTAAVTTWYPEIGYRYNWSRRQSAQIHMAWMRVLTPARLGRPHTDTRGFAYSIRYDYRWPWARHFHPHFHLGLEYLDMRSRERFSVDGEGFVLERYPSRAHRRLNWLVGTSYHFEDYGWGGWVIGFDWHDPFGLSRVFAGGFRTFVRYRIRID